MKKIGIITIIDNNNYGNRLQNYAIQCILQKYKFETSTILNEPFKNDKKLYLLRIIKYIKYKGTYSNNLLRYNNFKKFNKRIFFSNKLANPFKKINEFDFVITGSDQVWNPRFGRLRDVDLLNNVHPKKRIAYSASFGINNLPKKYINKLQKSLLKFKAISVREYRGKEIIEELTGRKDVEVLIDPTMLLTAEEWDKVSKRPEQLNLLNGKKYILNYFLGNLSEERRKEIEKIAKESECEIINILDKKNPFYKTGPSEFLYLEKNAFLICTDSFHSSVFAILYNRPFIIFDREQDGMQSMNSRIDTLINKFELKNRIYNGSITKENLNHDYTKAHKILEKEREKSLKFLKKALDIKE